MGGLGGAAPQHARLRCPGLRARAARPKGVTLAFLPCAAGALCGCLGPSCSVCLPSGTFAPHRSAEFRGCSPGLSVARGPFCSDEVPSGILPFSCSTGWRPSLGPVVDGTVCAFACRAKMCKIARAAFAGLCVTCQDQPHGAAWGSPRRHGWRGKLSPWWLPAPSCRELCRMCRMP